MEIDWNVSGYGPSADFFESPKKTGWLTKLGGTGLKANWRRRYVVLDHHYLFYYKSEKDRAPCGNICLPDYDIVTRADTKECKKPNAFMITSSDNISPSSSSECKRVYYMFADTEIDCVGWCNAIQEEMIAIIDPKQKHYFTLHDMGIHSSVKNGYQDMEANFDDITTVVEDGSKLEHVTAQRPKKPHTRAPSRGNKDFNTFDEDDISTFAFSPVSAQEEPTPIGRKSFQRKVSPLNKPIKPPVPPKEPQTTFQEKPITKPKPAFKPKNLMKHSSSVGVTIMSYLPSTDGIPINREIPSVEKTGAVSMRRTLEKEQKSVDQVLTESIPIPTPRRTAPSIPDIPDDMSRISIVPPTPPEHPCHFMPPQQELTPPPQQKVTPPLRVRKSPSLSSGSKHSSLGSIPDINVYTETNRLSGNNSKRNSSSSTSSSNGSLDNVYQVPRSRDPIYQIPTSTPVYIQANSEENGTKIPIRKLHSVGHTMSSSPKASVDSPNYSHIVTDYFCSSPNSSTPPPSPIPNHKQLIRNVRSLSMPRNYTISVKDTNEEIASKLSSNSNNSKDSYDTNNNTTEHDVSERILSQIRELEDQLFSLTSSSPRRGSLSPRFSQSNSSLDMHTEAQKLIDSIRSVVFEAISFHKQASEELQLARTEKRIAEKERQDAELNRQNIQTLLSSFQQRTPEPPTY